MNGVAPLSPGVPTVAEAGLPGTEVVILVGIVASAGTPMGIVRKIQNVIVDMVKKPGVRECFPTIGVEAVGNPSKEFARAITADLERWSEAVKRASIQPK